MTDSPNVDAGDFDAWLRSALHSFRTGEAIDVPCGDCRGCCSAGRFVHIAPSDQSACSAIPRSLLQRAPGMPEGYAVMGYRADGLCPMLEGGNCSIYPSRPSTCRTFDCRVLAAAGLRVEGKWSVRINERVQAWRFSFTSEDGPRRLQAVRDAANFIRQHPAAFPGGRAPTEPTTVAVLALKVHSVFLDSREDADLLQTADAIVAASRRFDGVGG